MKRFQRFLAIVLSVSILHAGMIQAAHAGMISTEQVANLVSADQQGSGHARLASVLTRADVRAEMERLGVDPAFAAQRVAALTDADAARLADQIHNAPAGGDIIGVILTVFIILLVTDILGFTKVFPFTRSVR